MNHSKSRPFKNWTKIDRSKSGFQILYFRQQKAPRNGTLKYWNYLKSQVLHLEF